MNIFDNDFPEVTEAYRGSLEDWLELFERYAFPKTGDTETSAEMKRIFKRYTEVTYEDWLDIIIKCARDEIWYEEKINLSIRELYLVVNKVARISEKLRAAYNRFSNFDILTEEEAVETPKNTFTTTFDEVEAKLNETELIESKNDAGELVYVLKNNLEYWQNLRKLMLGKALSMGRTASKSWYTRFLSFYKSYYAEDAIKNDLSEKFKWSVVFADGDDKHRTLAPDAIVFSDNTPQYDYKATINGQEAPIPIECKTFTTPSGVHGAKLITRYKFNSSGEVAWVLVGHLDNILNCFKSVYDISSLPNDDQTLINHYKGPNSKDLTGYHKLQQSIRDIIYNTGLPFYILADSVKLTSAMTTTSIQHLTTTDYSKNKLQKARLDEIELKLSHINDALNALESTAEDTAIIIVDNQRRQINKLTDKIDVDNKITTDDSESASPKLAVDALHDAVDDLAASLKVNVDKNS
jgi:uncharacterized coiled-coil protein SlyX